MRARTPATRFIFVVLLLAAVGTRLLAQTGSVRVALWKNDAGGAFSILSDDYGAQYYGDLAVIDSTTENRGIHLGFTTISDWAACLGSCGEQYWDYARTTLVPKGHELVTHSYDHQWYLKTPENLALIFDTSQAHIEADVPENECLFFGNYGGMYTDSVIKVGPFWEPLEDPDIMPDSLVGYLKHQKFIGARMSGGTTVGGCDGVNPSSYDPFRTSCNIWMNAGTASIDELQHLVQCAVDNGGHLNYMFHNLGEEVSWSPIGFTDWITVLDYLKGRMDAGDLWVETVQRITKYMMERDTYTVGVTSDDGFTMTIEFNTSVEVNPSPMIDNSVYDEYLTLVITTPHGHSSQVNADPFGGPVTVQYGTGGVTSIMQNGTVLDGAAVGVARAATCAARLPVASRIECQPGALVVHNAGGGDMTVRVHALSGRCVLRRTVAAGRSSVNTSSLAPGLYTAVAGGAAASFVVSAP